VCFLAQALWRALAQWMRCGRLGAAPRTLLGELAKIESGDVVLKPAGPTGENTASAWPA